MAPVRGGFGKLGILGRLAGWLTRKPDNPTIFHITHHKAGSQWINRIFHALAYDRLVLPEIESRHFLGKPAQAGKIYPTLYVTREQFESVEAPRDSRRFVVIRDLRDTLVSAYFSFKHSHPIVTEWLEGLRATMNQMSVEDGLLHMMDARLFVMAQVQWSWVAAGEELVRYEDLLVRDEEILDRILLRKCGLPVTRARFLEVVRANRFEARSGRKRGEEDIANHERKGIAGDWRNHFTPRVIKEFKGRYGSLLVATGYEKGFDW
jgi:sulfotransferase family protein